METLHSYKNPTPEVDPYFTEDDDKVFDEAVRVVSIPATIDRDKDRFIQNVIDVAFAVHETKENCTWAHLEGHMGNVNSQLPKELRKWTGLNNIHTFARPIDLARYVHSDNPEALHDKIGAFLLKHGAKRMLYGADDKVAHFHKGELAADAMCGLVPLTVNPSAFAVKYKFKVPRPHRVITDILQGNLEADDRDIRSLQRLCGHSSTEPPKELMEDFTVVDGATPNHWSYIAMHATNAGAARILAAALYDHRPNGHLDRQVCQNLAQNGMGRMVLGVHTPADNIEGFRLGQNIAYEAVPNMMAQFTDADPDKVKARIDDFMMEF